MRIRTLGGLALEDSDFSRPVPLLILAYLTIERRVPRKALERAFFPDAADPGDSLTTALRYLEKAPPGSAHAGATWSSARSRAIVWVVRVRSCRRIESRTSWPDLVASWRRRGALQRPSAPGNSRASRRMTSRERSITRRISGCAGLRITLRSMGITADGTRRPTERSSATHARP